MRTRLLVAASFAIACALGGTHARADAVISDWIGEYAMNHDGHRGTLRIREIKADCASPPLCALVLDYLDPDGNRFQGTINTVNQRGQHMQFTIAFPNNRQVFQGWIFSWDKNYIAGTTVWGGRTFGFYAAKSGTGLGSTTGSPSRSLQSDGSVKEVESL